MSSSLRSQKSRRTPVTLDFNHPMAGERLHFDVEVTGLRAATPEELKHGHVHDDER
jgi:FKBP-type peptidyl-prolyl cis-trans isomerase SlyD